MSFHEQSWQGRFAAMGDEAEGVFEAVEPKHHRCGLNRPPFYLGDTPKTMTYLPDYMVRGKFVEVMGIGRDGVLKLKVEKVAALMQYVECIGPVDLFVYDRGNGVYYQAPMDDWWDACGEHAPVKKFPEGNEYWALKRVHFPCEPCPLRVDDDPSVLSEAA